MSRPAIDFKRILGNSGSLHRVMKSPGVWPSIYIDRYKRFGDIHGAIVFPEQLLGLKQNTIWMVSTISDEKNGFRVSVNVTETTQRFLSTRMWGQANISTVEEVHAFERKTAAEGVDPNILLLVHEKSSAFTELCFVKSNLFTNEKSANFYAKRFLKEAMKRLD